MAAITHDTLDDIDSQVARWLRTHGLTVLRYGLATVFVWFGALKPLGFSPAAGLIEATIPVLPAGLAVTVIGIWEIVIGLSFLSDKLLRVAVPLMGLHMLGTFSTIVLVPGAIFVQAPLVLTLEGQYVIKNIILVGAAMVVGGFLVRPDEMDTEKR
jgi:uncharacterized membrane protein YkgB